MSQSGQSLFSPAGLCNLTCSCKILIYATEEISSKLNLNLTFLILPLKLRHYDYWSSSHFDSMITWTVPCVVVSPEMTYVSTACRCQTDQTLGVITDDAASITA